MRRYMALLLVFVMLLFAACGSTQPSTKQTTGGAETKNSTTNTEQDGTDPSSGAEPSQNATESTQGTATDPSSDPTTVPTTEPTTEPSTKPSTDPNTTPSGTGNNSSTGDAEDPTLPTESTPAPEELTINPTSLKLNVGETGTITATYNGTKSLSWTSSNTSIATVNQSGKVTAKSVGTATITVQAGSLKKACDVTVLGSIPPTPTLVITTKNNTEIYVGDKLQLMYEYSGDESKLTWRSTYTDTITVDNSGMITGVAAGNSIITVTDGTLTRRINIYVNARETEPELPKTTSLLPDAYNAPLSNGIVKFAGDSMQFRVTAEPYGCNPNIVVTSSNSNVVSVSWRLNEYDRNIITLNFKSQGNATITVESADGAKKLSYSIQVRSGYNSNPGSGLLTPEQFVSCVNGVIQENGVTVNTSKGYRVLHLSDSDLTWANARSFGEGWIHEFWAIGKTSMGLSYHGTNADGKHIFYIHR